MNQMQHNGDAKTVLQMAWRQISKTFQTSSRLADVLPLHEWPEIFYLQPEVGSNQTLIPYSTLSSWTRIPWMVRGRLGSGRLLRARMMKDQGLPFVNAGSRVKTRRMSLQMLAVLLLVVLMELKMKQGRLSLGLDVLSDT
jgi:hypothetical protein